MFPVRDEVGSFLSPSLQDSSGCLALQNILPVSSLLLSFPSSPSITRIHPPPSSVWSPPSSVRRRATNPLAPVDQCPLLVPRPSVPYAGLHPPPRPIRLVVLGLGVGVGGGAKETAPPAVVLSPSSRRQASPDRRPSACLRPTLDFPLDSCGPQ